MKVLLFRAAGSLLGLLAGCIVFGVELTTREKILCVIFMTLIFTFLHPVTNLLLLPLNLVICGVPGLLADALLVILATGHRFGYSQALLIALIVALCYIPYKSTKHFYV